MVLRKCICVGNDSCTCLYKTLVTYLSLFRLVQGYKFEIYANLCLSFVAAKNQIISYANVLGKVLPMQFECSENICCPIYVVRKCT